MAQYDLPLREIQFVLFELLNADHELKSIAQFKDLDQETISQVIEEGGKFATNVLLPLNQSGDQEGCHWQDEQVTTPKGFKEAYQQYIQAGWPSLMCAPEYGGQNLPMLLGNILFEIFYSVNQAWTMYPGLTQGAYACLAAHASDALKSIYLPQLASGHWSGTMCLTEPQCGTDLSLIRTKAVPQQDGRYQITGTKIFISSGEHDLTENIVHLVLARTPNAPAGNKGISLFVVPKFLPDQQSQLGQRNALVCSAIEKKLGIHGNATCVMNFDGATGWLVGEENRGLANMFVMMNKARLGVGTQSIGLSEAVYQNALAYAKTRLQMRALSGAKAPDQGADPIIVHPDVRRMLLIQKAYLEAGRALSYWIALQTDQEHTHPDAKVREQAGELVALLTPVYKAFATDNGFECASLGLQVHGGHGYIADVGIEQYLRDARINMIYEGTNGVQALDLLGRKILKNQGKSLKKLGALIRVFIQEQGANPKMSVFIEPLTQVSEQIEKITMTIAMKAMKNPEEVGAVSVPYLRLIGHWVYGYLWAKMVVIALKNTDSTEKIYASKLKTAHFYFSNLFPETKTLIKQIQAGAQPLMEISEDLF